MSVVSGIMLITSCVDDDKLSLVNEWMASFDSYHSKGALKDVSDNTGGSKHPQYMSAWGAGINYGQSLADAMPEFLATLDWACPENVVLVCQPEDGPTIVWRPAYF